MYRIKTLRPAVSALSLVQNLLVTLNRCETMFDTQVQAGNIDEVGKKRRKGQGQFNRFRGYTSLGTASKEGHIEITTLLILSGASLNHAHFGAACPSFIRQKPSPHASRLSGILLFQHSRR
jgi:hypothetical protein